MRTYFSTTIGLLMPTVAAAKNAADYGFKCADIPLPPGIMPGCASGSIDVVTSIANLATNGYTIAGSMTIVAFLYGALRMAMSRGSEGKEAGRKALVYGVLGFILVALTAAIVSMVKAYVYLIP